MIPIVFSYLIDFICSAHCRITICCLQLCMLQLLIVKSFISCHLLNQPTSSFSFHCKMIMSMFFFVFMLMQKNPLHMQGYSQNMHQMFQFRYFTRSEFRIRCMMSTSLVCSQGRDSVNILGLDILLTLTCEVGL